MINWAGSAVLLSLVFFGCQRTSGSEQARYYDDGRLKPSVALIPIIDSTEPISSWSLSEELTQSMVHKLNAHGKLFLVDKNKAKGVYNQLGSSHNPFGNQLDWIKSACRGQDFAVFMELIEHEEVPLLTRQDDDPDKCAAQLNISLRIRVIDLRVDEPKIILQEIIHDRHHIPRPFTKFHFHQEPWGKESFSISPMGLAHAQLVKEVSSRIEAYILLTVQASKGF